jgi:uncharacterized membrane protein YGL010W
MADDWGTVEQELVLARSLAQRGTLLAGANTVTVAVLLQTMGVLVSPGMAAQADAKFTLLVALLCFVAAAVFGAITNPIGPAVASGGVLATELSAARQANATSVRIMNAGVGFDVVGMVFLALTAVLFVF